MTEDHHKENLQSPFFSRPPQYPLDVNSVYRPKFSNIMSGKPFTKPFYHREGRQFQECSGFNEKDIERANKTDQSSPNHIETPTEDKLNTCLSQNARQEVVEDTSHDNDKQLPPEPAKNQEINENRSIDPVSRCKPPKATPHSKVQQKNTVSFESGNIDGYTTAKCYDLLSFQPLDESKPPFTGHGPSAPADIPSAFYFPPFLPISPVIISHPTTAFPSTAINSFVNPMLSTPVCSPGQPLKPFSKSKTKPLDNMPPSSFQDVGLPGFGLPQSRTNKLYNIMVHVDAGATFCLRNGPQEQQIPGRNFFDY